MSEEAVSVPPELGWDQMEEGILSKMEALEGSSKKGIFFPWRKGLSLFVVLLGAVLLGSWYLNRNLRQENQGKEALNIADSLEFFSPKPTDRKTNELLPLPNEEVDTKLDEEGVLGLVKDDRNRKRGRSISTQILLKNNEPSTKAGLDRVEEIGEKRTQNRSNALPKGASTQLDYLNILPFSPKLSSLDHSFSIFPLPLSEKNTPILPTQKRGKGRLIWLGGASIWSPGYGKNKAERQEFETSIISYQSQINYLYTSKNAWTVLVGLQYQQLESRFERTYILENYQITLTDTIVEKQVNVLTGKKTPVRGDVELTTRAERRVRHYNKIQAWQIPFAIGKSWTYNKWEIDLLLGGSINLLTNNTGRTSFQNELIFYEGSATDFLDNRWKVNALTSGRLTYHLDKHWGLTTALQFQQSLNNWSLEEQVKMHPGTLGLQAGLSYVF